MSGERPIGAAGYKQQSIRASCHTPPLPPTTRWRPDPGPPGASIVDGWAAPAQGLGYSGSGCTQCPAVSPMGVQGGSYLSQPPHPKQRLLPGTPPLRKHGLTSNAPAVCSAPLLRSTSPPPPRALCRTRRSIGGRGRPPRLTVRGRGAASLPLPHEGSRSANGSVHNA